MRAARQRTESPDPKTLKILIVDDDSADRKIYKTLLKKIYGNNIFIFEAANIADAIKLQRDHEPDCVLLDYMLPDSDGLSFLKTPFENDDTPRSAVIMVTGQGDEKIAVEAMKNGAADYVTKDSLNTEQISRIIANAVEKNNLRRQVKQYQEELELSNEELSDFAHIVAHDLKSPMRKIAMFCEMLAEDKDNDLSLDSRNGINRILVNAGRMQTLIDTLLKYAMVSKDPEEKTPICMNSLVAEIVEENEIRFEDENANIVCEELPEITGFPVRMKQLMSNLICNALKFCETESPTVLIQCKKDKNDYVFAVKDNGMGIPQEKLDYIFEPFKRLHTADKIEGTGLGLAICCKVVEMHGGKIWATSKENEGSIFYFSIPRA